MLKPAKLALVDGTVFIGTAFGADGEAFGEVCFNTSMTGYQEILTDPSYNGQIVAMTYPQIGNYGVNADDVESGKLAIKGFIVRELCHEPSNYRSTESLGDYLKRNGVVGIEGIDTRALVRKLRVKGAMTGVISSVDLDDASLIAKAQKSPDLIGRDLVKEVMSTKAADWSTSLHALATELTPLPEKVKAGQTPHVVAIDYGMKWNILRCLVQVGCKVTVVPGTWSAERVLAYDPDGIFLSNGPGDPAALGYAVDTVRRLLGKKPVFGICLGHQLIGQALGASTFKLKFGHRGANQPVFNELNRTVEITTQNHGFAVDPASLPDSVEVTHRNLNDGTCEGIRHRDLPVFSVQYHPEAAAGPHDSGYLFEEFRTMLG